MKNILIAILMINLPFGAQASQSPDVSFDFVKKCTSSTNCDLLLFSEILKIYRPSKEETAAADYIWSLKTLAENFIWKSPLWAQRDQIGNIVIRLPGTGKFKGDHKAKYFALQSHMDMVLAYADAKPGEDIRKYFVNGITPEVIDGWIYSKAKKTTLGSDNGIGMAMSLRYLLDPRISHPPLELIYTVQEEIGLVGASNLKIPLLSRQMLCLDGMTPEPGMIIAGAQGGATGLIKAPIKGEVSLPNSSFVQVTLTKLAGGHSGGAIHLKVLNGIRALAAVFDELLKFDSTSRTQRIVAGDIGIYNKIPNLFQATFLINSTRPAAEIKVAIENRLKAVIAALPDENKAYNLDIQFANASAAIQVATTAETLAFFQGVITSPNGVLETDPKFPNGVKTSSNLSFWSFGTTSSAGVKRSDDPPMSYRFGFMSRSFTDEGLKKTFDAVSSSLMNPLGPLTKPTIENASYFPPWMAPANSTLLKKALSLKDVFQKTYFLAGGLEPSVFSKTYPDMDVLAIGPLTMGAHTVNERLEITSVARISKAIEKLLQ